MAIRLSDVLRLKVAPGGTSIEERWISLQCHQCLRETTADEAPTAVDADTTEYFCECGNLLARADATGHSYTGGIGVKIPPATFN
jgi:hypothetical protein